MSNRCCAPSQESRRPGPSAARAEEPPPSPEGAALVAADLVELAGGEFTMGTDGGYGYPLDGEGPAHRVELSSFAISRYAVTNAQFAAFAAATGYRTEAERHGASFVFAAFLPADAPPTRAAVAAPWREVEGADWKRPEGPGSGWLWAPPATTSSTRASVGNQWSLPRGLRYCASEAGSASIRATGFVFCPAGGTSRPLVEPRAGARRVDYRTRGASLPRPRNRAKGDTVPKFVTIGYGDRAGYDRTDSSVRDAAHEHDERLRADGTLMGVAGQAVQVRNHDAAGVATEEGPFLRSDLPVAGFAVIEAPSLQEALALASKSPCAVAQGVVEVWPLESTP